MKDQSFNGMSRMMRSMKHARVKSSLVYSEEVHRELHCSGKQDEKSKRADKFSREAKYRRIEGGAL